MEFREVAIAVFAVVLILAAVRIFRAPLKLAFKILLNTGLGFLGLIIFNMLSKYTGIALGVNLLNSVVIGVLGLPGFALLLLLKWLFML